MNLGDLEQSVYDVLGYSTTPESVVTRFVRREINLGHRMILSKRGMTTLRRKILPFSCIALNPLCVLPQASVHIAVIIDRTNRRPLDEVSLQQLRARDPGRVYTNSIPEAYTVINYAGAVAQDPSAAAQIYAVSDSTSDTSAIAVSIEGIITGGYQRRASVGLNGTTPVALDSNVTWEQLTKFYISAAAAGSVTLTQGSGGTELARITQGHTYARYTLIELQGIPATALQYYADVEIRVEDMANLKDEPLLPEDFHYLLECAALKRFYQMRKDMDGWKVEDARWRQGVDELTAWLARKGSLPMGQNNSRPWSQLGPMFPAGS